MSDNEFTAQAATQAAQKAFSPMLDAAKSFGSRFEIPEAGRDYMKRAADVAAERANAIHSGAGKMTDAAETSATQAVAGLALWSRQLQAAAYDDATALFAAIGKVATAKTLDEAVQYHVDYLRQRSDVTVDRMKTAFSVMAGSVADGAKKVGENVTKIAEYGRAA